VGKAKGTHASVRALRYRERQNSNPGWDQSLRRMSATAVLLLSGLVGAGSLSGQTREGASDRVLTLGVSFHDVSGRLGSAAALEVGYRPARRFFAGFRPDTGVMVAWDGAVYGFVGLSVPVSLPGRLTLTPSFGVGAFGAGEYTDLGSVMEFRSAISLSIPGVTAHPLDVSFYHLSNAGLRRPNPGMEVLAVSYSFHRGNP